MTEQVPDPLVCLLRPLYADDGTVYAPARSIVAVVYQRLGFITTFCRPGTRDLYYLMEPPLPWTAK